MSPSAILNLLAAIAALLFIRFWLGALVNSVAAQRERQLHPPISWLRRLNLLDTGAYSLRGRQLMVTAHRNFFLGLVCGSLGAFVAAMAQHLTASASGSSIAKVPPAISAALVILFLSSVAASFGAGLYSVINFMLGWRARKSADVPDDERAVSARAQLSGEFYARALRGGRLTFWSVLCAVVTLMLLRAL